MPDVEDSMALLEEGLSLSSMSSSSDLSSDEADPALNFGPDLFIDDEDRENLMAMPELQREEILLKRKEMLDKSKERREAQAKWRLEQRSKRRESMQEVEQPTSTRAKRQKKAETGKDKAIQDIRGRRNKQIRARQSEVVREHSEDDEEWQDAESDEADEDDFRDNEVPQGRRMTLSPSREAAVDLLTIRSDAHDPIDYETMRSVQLRRDRLESLVEEPFFDDVVKGMFCRIGLGTNDTTGEHVYRAVVIVSVTDYPRTYMCGTKETSKALRVAFGASEKTFKITQVSNHGIDKNEAGQWIRAQQNDGLSVPTIGQCIAMKLAAEKLRRTFKYTPEMIDEMVQRKNALRAGKSHNMTQQKLLFQRELQIAIESGDKKRQSEIESRLDSLNEYILTLKRRQDNTVDVLNRKIRQANKLLDMKSDLANLLVQPMEPIARPPISSRTPTSAGGDDHDTTPSRLEYQFMNQALKKLAKAHENVLRIDVRAPPQPVARKSTYLDLHPNAARVPPKYANRHEFQRILTVQEWRKFKRLE